MKFAILYSIIRCAFNMDNVLQNFDKHNDQHITHTTDQMHRNYIILILEICFSFSRVIKGAL